MSEFMESYGEKLKRARTEKKYSLEQAAQETHISKRFIEAMEEENTSVFPAETYLLGFLRNYSEYLSINADEIITLYKNIKIQEQPIPMDELLHGKSNPVPVLLILIIIAGAALLGFGGFFAFQYFTNQQSTETARADTPDTESTEEQTSTTAIQDRKGEEFDFTGGVMSQPFSINDSININFENRIYRITVSDIADKATITLPDKTIKLNLLDPYNLDVNNDTESDIELVLTDIDSINNEKRVIMRITEIGTLAINIDEQLALQNQDEEDQETTEDIEETTEDTEQNESSENQETETTHDNVITTDTNRQIVLNSSRIKSFTLNVNFTGNCFVRYIVDGKNRSEHFYQKNDPSLVIDTARSSIRLSLSNAGAVDADIDGTQLSLGGQGQVATTQIEWIKNPNSGDYELVVFSVD
jgi:cytoskeleton protein RodZ